MLRRLRPNVAREKLRATPRTKKRISLHSRRAIGIKAEIEFRVVCPDRQELTAAVPVRPGRKVCVNLGFRFALFR